MTGEHANSNVELEPQHLERCTKVYGLTAETTAAAKISTVRGGAIRDILGPHIDSKTGAKMGPAIAIPYLDRAGAVVEFTRKNNDGTESIRPLIRLRPDHPRKELRDGEKKKRERKYESPLGSGNRAYIPPGVWRVLDEGVDAIITEGEFKALCATQHGFPCIALAGVWNFALKRTETDIRGKKTGPRELIPDLEQIRWSGRTVTICYDSDSATNPDVQWARWTLAELLREQGATVRIATLPAEPDGAKNGIDDYIVRHGPDEFRKIIDAAEAAERPESNDPRPTIIIGADEYRVNVDAIVALTSESNLYQRGGSLVRVVRTGIGEHSTIARAADSPVVRDIPHALLRSE